MELIIVLNPSIGRLSMCWIEYHFLVAYITVPLLALRSYVAQVFEEPFALELRIHVQIHKWVVLLLEVEQNTCAFLVSEVSWWEAVLFWGGRCGRQGWLELGLRQRCVDLSVAWEHALGTLEEWVGEVAMRFNDHGTTTSSKSGNFRMSIMNRPQTMLKILLLSIRWGRLHGNLLLSVPSPLVQNPLSWWLGRPQEV
jgi:hypothetical protein